MGDRPLEGKTPLKAAEKPNMDEISREGINGIMDVISPGIVPGSDTAHLHLLGYGHEKYYPGRGVFEALGAGIELRSGDVAFRANFATVDDRMTIKDRRAGRKGSKELEKAIDGMMIDNIKIIFRNTTEHRCVVVMRPLEDALSARVSDVDPHAEGEKIQKCRPLNGGTEEIKTSKAVNEFVKRSYEILSEHPVNRERIERGEAPANIVILRGAGKYVKVEEIEERWGFGGACVAGASLYKGVAKFIGMEVLKVEGATGRADTDLKAKADAAIDALKRKEFVFIHVKATDNFGHDGDFEGKTEMISRIDSQLIGRIMDHASADYIVLTADHSTPVSIRRHSADPVPVAIAGEGVRKDDVEDFDEFSAAHGGMCRIRGKDLLPILSDLMGYYRMYGV